jgi:hypothetical protein
MELWADGPNPMKSLPIRAKCLGALRFRGVRLLGVLGTS